MIQIRPATDADIPTLAPLFLETRIKAFPWFPPESFHLDDFVRDTAGEDVYLAHDSNLCPLGFISVWTPDSFIHHLFVSPDEQGRGIGSLLLQSLDSWLPRPYRLKCLLANRPAKAFYVRHGWKVVSTGDDPQGQYALMELA
ncbi:GNAT family N-acetyltransferase [bacterium]|nr:MAG: GNAT family N-acetyltransferase [bacterium]